MIHLKNILLISFLIIGLNSFAQIDSIQFGKLAGKVIDAKTKKPIEYAVITIEKDSFKKSKYSDKEGDFVFSNISVGNYSIYVSYTGYSKMKTENLYVLKDSTSYNVFVMSDPIKFIGCNFGNNHKLIEKDEPTQQNLNKQQIMRMPY